MAKVQKIILFGSESTGKSTLAARLAAHYQTLWCPEFSRTYLQLKNEIEQRHLQGFVSVYEDIEPIAIGQLGLEDSFLAQAKDILFYDTNLLTNLIYSHYYFGKAPSFLSEIVKKRTYDFYLLLDTDIAWQADPLRDRRHARAEIQQIFKNALIEGKQNFVEIKGLDEERFENAVSAIEKFLLGSKT